MQILTLIVPSSNGLTAVQVKYIAQSRRYRQYVARQKPFLDKQKVLKRLEWACVNWFRNWDEAIWTDKLQLGTGNHSVHPMVTRKPGEAYLPECLAPTFQSGHEALMVWGCISHGYKGPLIQLEMAPWLQLRNGRWRGGGFNSEGYVMQVLNGPLKDFIAQMEKVKGHRMLVVEDGAPAHKGKLAKQACEELGIKHIAHPPSSPDLNPIEPLWMELKRRVYSTPGARRSLEHLWNATEAAWKSFTADDINKYTRKMPSWYYHGYLYDDLTHWQFEFAYYWFWSYAVGIGGMTYGNFVSSEDGPRLSLLDQLLELGRTHWDTARGYGDSEELISNWFKRTGKYDQIFLVTKFGVDSSQPGGLRANGTPKCAEKCFNDYLEKLGVDIISLPGKIRHIGLSQPSFATIRRAHKVHPIVAIQVEYSPFERLIEQQEHLLEIARELVTAVMAYSPLGKGLLTEQTDHFSDGDFRKQIRKYSQENFQKILKLIDGFKQIGKAHDATSGQVALAYLLEQGDDIIPISG
ncbi:aldo/keto reductase family protein [Rhizoctonia solani]|uniref:Aldo/keto reductase family protein n=1 Tax=Rhizoctonia solani TaxID=456999 RepID=A0A8H8NW59_9AGAM|nr:aldo/keto reductase family protein [Rhizoctonia solani]QRW21034.1 aldo/keto reductase family protein [Rhizoctonia solani]